MTGLLLATDLSPHGDRALSRAALLAASHGGTLHVVPRDLLTKAGLAAALEQAARMLHDDLADAGLQADLAVLEMIRAGEPDQAIVQAAREAESDMIVLSAPHADLLVQMFRGSVQNRVVRAAPSPVLGVRRRARQQYRRIVVAVDLSQPARRALDVALRLLPNAVMAEVELGVVHAGVTEASADQMAEERAQVNDMVTGSLARLAAEGRTAPRRVTTEIVTGDAVPVIAAAVAAQQAELVVVGTLGLTGMANLLLGSTAEALLGVLPCDVLAVRQPA